MFLVDSAQAAADWDGTLAVVNNILQRADAEVVAMRKWQERKLAYDIDRATRGTYILCYFKADGRRISGIEKDVHLSEKVIRVLVLTTEKRPAEMLERDISGEPEKPVEKPAEETAATEASATPAEEAGKAPEAAPAEKSEAAPAEKSEEAPAEKPEEAPAEKTEEAPAEKPEEAPAEKPEAAEPVAEAVAPETEDDAEETKDKSAE
jgi:small subunit ribosomal protein S6